MAPLNSDGPEPALQAAAAKKLPVLTIDCKVNATPCKDYLAFLGSNFVEQGKRAADAMIKATGGKGLHVVVPIEPHADWETAKTFARDVAARLAAARPERYTTNPLKEARSGRIFLDHLRNSRGATAVAAYSTRARPGAPVAMPLAWKPLYDAPTAPRYCIADFPAEDPWKGFFEVRQRLPG